MSNFSKTYYTDKLNITIKIKRDCICSMGCRLTIKDRTNRTWRGLDRLVYTWFHNNKNMFSNYRKEMIESKVPKKIVNEIIEDIKTNLMFQKVVTYIPIETPLFKN